MPKSDATFQQLREANRAMQELTLHNDRPYSDFQKLVNTDKLKSKLYQSMAKHIGVPTTERIMKNIESTFLQRLQEFGEKSVEESIARLEIELLKRNSQKLE